MKCVFDNQLKSQDTPLLMLYKRVFPKWTYNGYVPPISATDPSSTKTSKQDEDEPMSELFQ